MLKLQKDYKEILKIIFSGTEYFDGTFSLQMKSVNKLYQASMRPME